MKNKYVTFNVNITLDQEEYHILLKEYDRVKTKFHAKFDLQDLVGAYVVGEIAKIKNEGRY